MAKLIYIEYAPHTFAVEDRKVVSSIRTHRVGPIEAPICLKDFPVLLWDSGELWDEANLYLTGRATAVLTRELKPATVQSDAEGLLTFANFLEGNPWMTWFAFGEDRADRPTNAFRGFLIRRREDGKLRPSTASAKMAAVLRFYRWVQSQGLLSSEYPVFENRTHKMRYQDRVGFAQTLTVYSTNLHIPNKQSGRGVRLEGGLKPVSAEVRDQLLEGAKQYSSIEFQLMLALGFATGMRIQSILDLKVRTLFRTLPGETPRAAYLRIGPNANPPVATKFDINGNAFIPIALLDQLVAYATSSRRMSRAALAKMEDQDVLFLNRFSRRYGRRGADKSPSINKDMERLRAALKGGGLDLSDFYFHCSRATFATLIALAGLSVPGVKPISVIRRIKDLLLHKNEATSQRYIDYIDEAKVQTAIEDEYAAWLFGNDVARAIS